MQETVNGRPPYTYLTRGFTLQSPQNPLNCPISFINCTNKRKMYFILTMSFDHYFTEKKDDLIMYFAYNEGSILFTRLDT